MLWMIYAVGEMFNRRLNVGRYVCSRIILGVGVNFSPNNRRLVSSVVSFSSERLIIVVFLLGTGLVVCRFQCTLCFVMMLKKSVIRGFEVEIINI